MAAVQDDDPRLSPIMLRGELVESGLTDRAIAQLVATGVLHRVRFGAYVANADWRACDPSQRHGILVRAVLRQARTPVVVSHISALTEWEVPIWDLSLRAVHITRVDQRAGRREAGVCQHLGALRAEDVVHLNGIALTSGTRTALDCACLLDVEQALVIVNDLLHRRLTSLEQLAEGARFMTAWPGSLRHQVVLRLADGRLESVGESRFWYLCWRQGLPMPIPQYEVRDSHGNVVARLDFAWPQLGVFAEFDGESKYLRPFRVGDSAADVVLREKRREDLVRELTGWRAVRVDWSDLGHPRRTAHRIRAQFQLATGTA